jgi:probable phosphomutase (TIGR03848 family)
MPLLLLIRHALTDATGRSLTGWTPGVHLSEQGRGQARALAERLTPVPITAMYSSPLERCLETAEPVAAQKRLSVTPADDLGEVRYGDWTGRTLAQLSRTRLWKVVQSSPSNARFPNGESLLEVQERAAREILRIAAMHPRGVVAAFSHADVIRLLLAHFSGMHVDLFQRLVISPASVTALALGDGIPRVLRVNDTGAVADLIPAKPRRPKMGT